ncbi:MAG: hypothetical protein QOD88_1095, partial [Mycobacterium sp.]|nr:hypothetical protein [Mycobacterium sp.]
MSSCPAPLVERFFRRLFRRAVLRIWMMRFVEVNMGITPRNVRSEGVAPCR